MPPSRSNQVSQNGTAANTLSNGDTPTQTITRRRPREDDDTQGPPCATCRTRKVKCDRQQPECSNCRRGGVPCEYSSAPSRGYQVKELIDAFSSVTSRVDRLEETIANLVEQMRRPNSGPGPANGPGSGSGVGICAGVTGLESPSTSASHVSTGKLANAESSGQTSATCEEEQAVDQHADEPEPKPEEFEVSDTYPAVRSLFRSLQRRLERAVDPNVTERSDMWALAAQQLGPRRILQEQLDKFPFAGGCLDFPITSDGGPIIAPPRWAVEACIPTYLEHVNSLMPIFDETELRDGIAFYYESPPCHQYSVQALTYSNVLLLAKTLDFYAERTGDRTAGQEAAERELTRALLQNCDRAMEHLGEFVKPTAEYLRCLLTLALVCSHYYSAPAYSRVLISATSLIRTMGLHQTTAQLSSSWEDLSEAERFFWIAYTMDKQNVFISCQAGDLYLFECRFPLHPCDWDNPTPRQLFGALAHLMAIWEDIYAKLYSPRSTMCGTEDRKAQASSLRSQLYTWLRPHKPLLGEDASSLPSALKPSQTELTCAFNVTLSLIDRCDPSLPPQQRYRDPSRLALEGLVSLGTPKSPHDFAILTRIFRNYPMVAFHDLFVVTLSSQKHTFSESAELLHAVRRMLEALQSPHSPESYYNKLHLGIQWCTEQLDILHNMLAYFNSPDGCPDLDEVVGGFGMGAASRPNPGCFTTD
ncbi:hypothetical protein BJY01DRAFT_232702 [Aspergillus pseudoustus]|uniref:Zn(2)-C6 fungal-type domain-containing protein n=1 Tax=Aspergillus pseudoustus TaxID=1810923 RepID=A0ABR4KJ98_9EURO